MPLWGGRFQENTGGKFARFNSSLPFDYKLYKYDIKGSKIHVKMLARQGIISEKEKEKLLSGLEQVRKKLAAAVEASRPGQNIEQNSSPDIDFAAEDIHTLVESMLKAEIGETAGKLHTARSRNDQVALDLKLYLLDNLQEIKQLLKEVIKVLIDLAREHTETIMPGYTHLQPAQPITFGHLLSAHCQQLRRDYSRLEDCQKRMNKSPLGSGALAGTTFAIDREWTAKKLGFSQATENSLDAVSDRDYLLEFTSAAVTIMTHLSSLAEEIIVWNSREYNFVEISDKAATGSSIMPQKKNPDIPELIRGKSGRILGSYTQLAHTLKSLPLAYNKDLQEDKEGVFDTVNTLTDVLEVLIEFIPELNIQQENMAAAASKGYVNATELADFLAARGVPFRQAHEAVGEVVKYALEHDIKLIDIEFNTLLDMLPLNRKEVERQELYQALNIENAVTKKDIKGGPAPAEVNRQLNDLENWLK